MKTFFVSATAGLSLAISLAMPGSGAGAAAAACEAPFEAPESAEVADPIDGGSSCCSMLNEVGAAWLLASMEWTGLSDVMAGTDLSTMEVGEAQGASVRVATLAIDLKVDCDLDGVDDRVQILNGDAEDKNGNGVPDHCEGREPTPLAPLPAVVPGEMGAPALEAWSDRLCQEIIGRFESGEIADALSNECPLEVAWYGVGQANHARVSVVAGSSTSLVFSGQAVVHDALLGGMTSKRLLLVLTLE